MDKNKSRVDMLAAGRKKLQQYRQKKDGKASGSQGKSAKKSSKHEHPKQDTDASSTVVKATASSQVPEGDITAPDGSSTLHSTESLLHSEYDIVSVEPSSETITPETGDVGNSLVHDADSAREPETIQQDADSSVPNSDDRAQNADANRTIETTSSDQKIKTDGMLNEAVSVTALEETPVTLKMESVIEHEGQDTLPTEGYIPDMSSFQARRDQVGAMQGADFLGSEQLDERSGAQLEGSLLAASTEIHKNAKAFEAESVGGNSIEGVSSKEEQEGDTDNASATSVATKFSDSDGTLDATQITLQPNEEAVSVTSVMQCPEVLPAFGDSACEGHLLCLPESPSISKDRSQEAPLMIKGTSVSKEATPLAVGSVYPISLEQLLNVIQGLREDDYRFLLKSREAAMHANMGNCYVASSSFPDLLERLKEELYLTNFTKDIFKLQLAEHSDMQTESYQQHDQLVREIALLRASLNEVHERSACSEEELSNSRSELQAIAGERQELQKQLQTAMAEAEEFSSRARELEISFGRSQEGFSVLSAELVDCKNLVISLQVENEALNGTLVSLTEEKNKLSDEKEFSLHENEKLLMELTRCNELVASLEAKNEMLNATLASVTEEQKQLVEDKESSHDMNEKLSVELAECKNLVTALQMDNSDLSGTLSLIREEREKLEEQKELLSRQNQDVSVEFDECKRSLASLKVENSNLNASLASITEDNKKLEDDRKHFVHETERLSSVLLDLQEHLSKERGDCMQLELDVKELTARIEQLMGENMFLHSSLDVHKAKLTELDSREGQIAEVGSQVRTVQMSSIPATHDGNSHQVLGDEASSALPTKPLYDEIDGDSSLELLDLEVLNDSCGFVGLKRHIDETEKLLERFEKAIEGLHSHSASLNQSDGVGGVSKLIQAFEHKAHNDEDEVEERVSNEFHLPVDPFMAMKGLVGDLRAVVKLIGLDAEKASEIFRVERDGRRSVKSSCNELTVQCEALLERSTCLEAINIELGVLYEVAKLHASEVEAKKNEFEVIYEAFKLREYSLISENTELGTKLSDYNELRVQYEALLEHTNSLETINIELGVLYEATKLYASEVEANKDELEILYEALKLRESSLKSENTELGTKLSDYEFKICEMQSQFNDFQGRSDEMAAVLHNELESLHKEVAGREVSLEEGWSSAVTQIFETVMRLEKSVGKYLNPNVLSGTHGILDRSNRATVSVSVVIEVIENVVQKLEAGFSDRENISNSYRELDEKFRDSLAKNELAVAILHKVYGDLSKLVIDSCVLGYEPTMRSQIEELDDPFDYNNYKPVIDQLESLFGQKLELQSVNSQLSSELMSRTKHIEKLSTQCLDLNGIQKLIADVEAVLKLEDSGTDSDRTPSSHLESLVSLLVQKYKEIGEQGLHGEEFGYKVMESTDVPENTQQLDALKLQQEIEILTLKESLHQAEEALHVAASKLQGKISELEQSEQRVSSIREKLSIAVAKGKGLIVQRDSLKQSLAETSSELDRCSQELQLKDARVEALESELSYIRNSATAIRESFLLKDSVLQRIEEILEDLDLPEHFHSGDIIEKVDWLARSAAANPSHPTDWEPKSFVEASSPDSGFVTVDAWKEDAHPDSNSGEELRRQFEELQRKFFESAEQNEMLEQSLMERNHLVQRWEELLNQIHMPSHLRTMEPEDRIEWLGSALLEASNERDSIQRKIDNLEDCRGSLTADLEDSHQKISDLQADLQSVIHEREHLSERLQALLSDHDELSAKVVHAELENESLQAEVTGLQDKLVEKLESEKRFLSIEGSISRLESLVSDALQDPGMSGLVSGGSPLEFFEDLVKQLIERYTSLKSVSPLLHVTAEEDNKAADETLVDARGRDALPVEETEVASLKKQLEEALQDLVSMKEERDGYLEKEQSLLGDVQELSKKREELLELLNQEEHKSASLREKLNVAVRKGKSVVQQRDALKQTLENMNSELERLKSEISRYENSIADYEQKIRELSSYHERAEALESENSFLSKRLEETEHYLQERERTLTPVLNKLADINFDVVMHTSDPVEKLEKIVKLCLDLSSAVASSEQESSKSKRATELLLAELNEVQERNDGLQEELAKAASELTELMKERDVAEAAKFEALSHAQKLSSIHAEEERKKRSETLVLKSSLNQVRGGLADIFNLLSDTFSSNLELLKDLEASIVSCLKGNDAGEVVSSSFYNASGAVSSRSSQNKESVRSLDSWTNANLPDQFDDNFTADAGDLVAHHLQEFMNEIGALKEKLNVHLKSLEGQASSVSSVVGVLQRERASQKESFEALKGEIVHLESTGREKDIEIAALSRNISLLYEACANAITEIENRKTELLKNNLFAEEPVKYADTRLPFSRQTDVSSEEYVKTMANRIISAVNEFAATKSDFAVDGLKEMKITVANLQKELQEKDIQKDRICMELVAQIKKAEAAAADYSREYHSSKALACDLEKQVEQMQRERESLEQRVKDLHDVQATSMELQNRVGSLTEKLSAKDQEIDALMQALDEEEVQMEELRIKIEGLEEVLQKKNVDLENLIASRAKVVKKLAITVSRFDELHDLSENLLSEVEKLQSQLQDRDAEISFLRNEVTRCTNDVLTASQMNSKRASEDIYELLTWLDAVVSRVEIPEVHVDDNNNIQAHEHKEVLQKRINSIISQLEDLQVVARSKDALLQAEKSKVEELVRREESLEKTLHEKESQLNLLQSTRDSGQAAFNSEIVEVEPVVNKWAVAGTSTASQVRSLRKGNNDQVAIAIDMGNDTSDRLEDEDDDKVHGFKSLTTSRIIPRFTRPVTDMVDGLWVSCDRALMRQPALRLCIMIYWAVLHAMLAAFVF